MMDIPTEREEEIFCAALEIEADAERMTYVKQACAGDAGLFEKLERMLSSYFSGEQLFREASPTSFSVVELAKNLIGQSVENGQVGSLLADDGEIGKQIGPYTLVQKIGEGGGGSVYLAEQVKPVRRQVALKIIKLGMDTKSVIARFEAERQVLAMMEHPNIAHVFDAGSTDEGRPYFVMELVQGTRITAYCDLNNLNIQQRLELFIQVCHAIQHAHQKGIIHRDIKPSNVIIAQLDGIAVPKVIDFGIAKAVSGQLMPGQTAVTAFEQFIGTPAYMSPEQADSADMDIDVRSDIYSLGVLLYELLTGKTPFDQKKLIRSGFEKLRRTIREVEPERPSAKLMGLSADELDQIAECRQSASRGLIALLAGDLDWIVMKALDKDRERRYRSADGFADDIQRCLNQEPVVARPPSRRYRLKKLVRRNKVVFASGGIVVAVLLISSSVSTWLLIEQRIAQRRAEVAEQEKGTIQKEAEILRLSVESQQKLAQALVVFRRGEMEQADAIIDSVVDVHASPGSATMFREIGDWHALNGRWDKAKARFDVLLQINEFEGAESTMDDTRSAALLVEQGHIEEYERFRESIINRYIGTDSPTVAQRIIRECMLAPANEQLMMALDQFAAVTESSYLKPETADSKTLKGWQAYAMAMLSYRRGDYGEALEWCEKAHPSNSDWPMRDLSVLLIRAQALMQLGRVDEAHAQLKATRIAIDKTFALKRSDTNKWLGFWFDRSFVRIHLREAESIIETASVNPE